jgi:tetratricopeptide (TPR) repeat protein
MRFRTLLPALGFLALAGCDETLTVEPTDEVEESQAIVDATSARAALGGAYDALTSGSYYGGDFYTFTEVLTDNAEHTGTYDEYADADANTLRSDDPVVEGVWAAAYRTIGRVNLLIERLPQVEGLDPEELDQMLGEVHFLRALAYHDLVRLFGDVPLVIEQPASLEEASQVTRAPVSEVYAQIESDLNQAATLMGEDAEPGRASLGAVMALRARVALYRGNWAAAEAAADDVIEMGYELAPTYGALFGPADADTPEDIFRLTFTPQEYQLQGYYYQPNGRWEVGPTEDIIGAYEEGDERLAWSIAEDDGDVWTDKWKTTEGGEDIHVIRFAEVLLIKAEAHARQGELPQAVAAYNQVRERAGLDPHVLGEDVSTQAQVLAAIEHERRVEFAFESDRWFDLVRTGRATTVLDIPATATLWPIPLGEIDVAPNLTQNPGY